MAKAIGTISQDLAKVGDNHCKKCGAPSGNLNMCPQHLAEYKTQLGDGTLLAELKAETAKEEKKSAKAAEKKLKKGEKVDMRSPAEVMWTNLTVKERAELCADIKLDGKDASKDWAALSKDSQEVISRPRTVTMPAIEEKPAEKPVEKKGRTPRKPAEEKKETSKPAGDAPKLDKLDFLTGVKSKLEKLLGKDISVGTPTTAHLKIPTCNKAVHFELLFHAIPEVFLGVELHFEAKERKDNKAAMDKVVKAAKIVTGAENWGTNWTRIVIRLDFKDLTQEKAAEKMAEFYKTAVASIK